MICVPPRLQSSANRRTIALFSSTAMGYLALTRRCGDSTSQHAPSAAQTALWILRPRSENLDRVPNHMPNSTRRRFGRPAMVLKTTNGVLESPGSSSRPEWSREFLVDGQPRLDPINPQQVV